MERVFHNGEETNAEKFDVVERMDETSDEIERTIATYSASRRARVWITVLAAFSVALSIDVLLSMSYIYIEKPPFSIVQQLQTPTTRVRVSEKLYNATLPLWKPLPDASQTLTKIAFGSCSSQEMPQPHWDTITKYAPDLFLLAGDNVYGDCTEATCHHLRQAYKDMAQHPSVQGAAPVLSVYATLDDHDYGLSSCDGSNPYKETARELFAEFFDIPFSTEFAGKDGVYRSAIWGQQQPSQTRLQVILLDTRFARSPFAATGDPESPYSAPPPSINNATRHLQMLSEKQWRWLEKQLQQPADLRLLVSSIQVLNDGTGFEAWRQIPAERDRLYKLIRGKSVVLLTGDRHVGGFYESSDSLIEVTASSFTHTVPLGAALNGYCATAAECDETDPRRIGDSVRENHFGSIEIDWTKRQFSVALRRTESTPGSTYANSSTKHFKLSDAGLVIVSRSYSFPF